MDIGRSPDGSGYSAEPEPSSTVSAVPVSIPNARRTPDGLLACISCPHDWAMPARYIATPKRTTGEVRTDWPVCTEHMQWAMVAGWFPILEYAAQAIEARRAETEGLGAKHESAVASAMRPNGAA